MPAEPKALCLTFIALTFLTEPLLAAAHATVWPVVAQEDKRSSPADPFAAVPTIKYESAFSDYRPFREQQVAPWKQVIDNITGIPGASGHAGHSGMTVPSATKEAAPSAEAGAEDRQTLISPPEESTAALTPEIPGSGLILQIDKANGKVKIAHDPIESLGWPKMTMFLRLRDAALADQVKENEKVEFFMVKSPTGYLISRFGKTIAGQGK